MALAGFFVLNTGVVFETLTDLQLRKSQSVIRSFSVAVRSFANRGVRIGQKGGNGKQGDTSSGVNQRSRKASIAGRSNVDDVSSRVR